MLTKIYIEALIANEKLADQVWEAWDRGEIDDAVVCVAWIMIAGMGADRSGLDKIADRGYSLPRGQYQRHRCPLALR